MRPLWAATYPLGLQALMHRRLRAGILPSTEIALPVWDTPRPSASCHSGPTGAISGGRFETGLGRFRAVRSLPDRHDLHHVLCRCGEGPEKCRKRGRGASDNPNEYPLQTSRNSPPQVAFLPPRPFASLLLPVPRLETKRETWATLTTRSPRLRVV